METLRETRKKIVLPYEKCNEYIRPFGRFSTSTIPKSQRIALPTSFFTNLGFFITYRPVGLIVGFERFSSRVYAVIVST